jgi:CBS domain containing-hemolysin-like protein
MMAVLLPTLGAAERSELDNSLALLFYVSIALGISFLCSLLEAALLSARSSTLIELESRGNRGAGILLAIKRTQIDDAISAILILNTLANTLGATMAGAEAARVFGSTWIGLFSGALAFMILIFSEIIPKTLGAVYTRAIANFVGRTLKAMIWLMGPVLVMARALTRLLIRRDDRRVSIGELAAVIDTASREGALSIEQSKLFANLLRFDEIQVEDVMTPRTVIVSLPVDATVEEMLSLPETEAFSRIPLYRGDHDNIVGYVLQHEVTKAVATGGDRSRPLESFMREIWFVPELISVGSALKQFLKRREPIAVVTDEHGGLAGLVTLEDLTETVLGAEIVDESDTVVDLRSKALELRDRRLERLRRKRERGAGGPAEPANPGS